MNHNKIYNFHLLLERMFSLHNNKYNSNKLKVGLKSMLKNNKA